MFAKKIVLDQHRLKVSVPSMAATIDLRDKKSLDPEVEEARAKLAQQREDQRKADEFASKERNSAYGKMLAQVRYILTGLECGRFAVVAATCRDMS